MASTLLLQATLQQLLLKYGLCPEFQYQVLFVLCAQALSSAPQLARRVGDRDRKLSPQISKIGTLPRCCMTCAYQRAELEPERLSAQPTYPCSALGFSCLCSEARTQREHLFNDYKHLSQALGSSGRMCPTV